PFPYTTLFRSQVEDPKLAKGLVKREVTRILSPGMVYDPDTLNSDKAHYLCAWEKDHIAFLDATTGEAFYYDIAQASQREQLWELLAPVEFVVSREQKESVNFPEQSAVVSQFDLLTDQNNVEAQPLFSRQDEQSNPLRLGQLPEASEVKEVTGMTASIPWSNEKNTLEPLACRRLRAYGLSMQGPTLGGLLTTFEKRSYQGRMRLSSTVLKHLEIFQTYSGEVKGSLFDAIKRTKTSGGARLLRSWMTFPLLSAELITQRQKQIGFWL